MKKYILILIAITCISSVHAYGVQAQEPEATPDSLTQTLKDRVQKVMQSDDPQVAGTITEQKTTFGLIGTLEKIVGSTVQIKTYQGQTRIAEVDRAAVISRLGKVIAYEELELNSSVIASGSLDQNGEYRVKSLRIVEDSVFPTRRLTLLGTLDTITTRALSFTPIVAIEGAPTNVTLSTRTTYMDILGQKVTRSLLKSGQQIVTVLPEGGTATSSALRVYSLSLTPTSTKSGTVAQ